MSAYDIVNAAFEGLGLFFILPNILRLRWYRDSRNIHLSMPLFFWSWGAWNMVYYPSLGQWFSAVCGVGILLANTVYLYYVWRYRNGPMGGLADESRCQ